jgi:molecular chaperone GrpE
MRLQAEFENAKRRMQESCETVKEYASEKIICDLLPLIDNLERAKASADITRDFDSLSEGIGLILRQLKDILGKEGLQVIECMGQLFDPVYHQAVQREENDEIEDDTILDEFQKGYLLKNKLIRPSLVKVAKNQN